METTGQEKSGRFSTRLSLVLAALAFVLSLAPYVLRERTAYPGTSFVRFRDGDTGEFIGFIKAEYGELTIARIGKNGSDHVEMKLGDSGLVVSLHKDANVVARWSLSPEGEKFEKLPIPQSP